LLKSLPAGGGTLAIGLVWQPRYFFFSVSNDSLLSVRYIFYHPLSFNIALKGEERQKGGVYKRDWKEERNGGKVGKRRENA